MDTKKKIVVIGSSNTDMVIKSDRLPKIGETILGGNFLMNHGGKGANQAVAAARLGGDVTFICKIGNDIFGNETLEMFHKEKIDTTYVGITPQEPSGVALINVDKKGKTVLLLLPEPTGLYLLMTYKMQNLPSNRHPSSSCSWKLQSRVSLMQPKWRKRWNYRYIKSRPCPYPTTA